MKVIRWSGLAALAFASVVAVASCSDSTGPSDAGNIHDPQGLETELDTLVSILLTGPLIGMHNVWQDGASALDQLSHGHGSGLAAIMGAWPTIAQGHGSLRIPRLPSPPRHPIGADGHITTMGDAIDDSYYTTVFAYNRRLGRYEDDGTNSGPVDGVRFVLYDVPPKRCDSCPVRIGELDPNKPLGYLDVLDRSDPTKSEVAIVVTDLSGTVTYANYSITLPDALDPVTYSYELFANGTLSDGRNDVDFRAHRLQTSLNDLVWDVSLTGSTARMSYYLEESTDPQTEDSHVGLDVTVQGQKDTVRFKGTSDFDFDTRTTATDYTILANSGTFARATATYPFNGLPVWLKDNYQPLTSAEDNLIEAIRGWDLSMYEYAFALVYSALLMVST